MISISDNTNDSHDVQSINLILSEEHPNQFGFDLNHIVFDDRNVCQEHFLSELIKED